jgi:hypothetical protein
MHVKIGDECFAGSAEEILRQLNSSAMFPCDTVAEYMARWNRHASNIGLPTLDNTSPHTFLIDMLRYGIALEV